MTKWPSSGGSALHPSPWLTMAPCFLYTAIESGLFLGCVPWSLPAMRQWLTVFPLKTLQWDTIISRCPRSLAICMWPGNRHGKAKYENGGLYEGDFENDVRSGWGLHQFPDGSWYEGEWSADRMTGETVRVLLFIHRCAAHSCTAHNVPQSFCKPG